MKVETKYYIDGKEVVLVAEAYSTKIYQDINNVDLFYVTSCEDIVASFLYKDNIIIEEKYKKRELL